jgi:chemotaxis protein CheC
VAQLQGIDRLRELVRIGALHAADAFTELVGSRLWMRVPSVFEHGGDAHGDGTYDRDEILLAIDTSGVFFELEGPVSGIVALLLPHEPRKLLIDRMLGVEAVAPELLASAIREVGNIVVSHACSAIADTLEVRLVPSVPVLALEDAGATLAALVARRPEPAPVLVESAFVDDGGNLRGFLLLIPDTSALT